MLIALWSAKGGSGTTVVASAMALVLGASGDEGVVLVDLAGDVPAVLGVAEPDSPGVADWLAAGPEVPADGWSRLEVTVAPRVRLIPRGAGPLAPADRLEVLAGLLATEHRPVVVDCGLLSVAGRSGGGGDNEAGHLFAASATHSLLVTRACYLGLRRAVAAPVRPSGVVLLTEPGRALGARDVEAVLGVPVVAEVHDDPEVARAVDAGLLASRLPRRLARSLRSAA